MLEQKALMQANSQFLLIEFPSPFALQLLLLCCGEREDAGMAD
jgi:hypothetical protein